MRKSEGRISHKVLKEIFPKKLKRDLASERIYTELKQMILSGKLKKGERLFREKIAEDFNVAETVVAGPFSRLKKTDWLLLRVARDRLLLNLYPVRKPRYLPRAKLCFYRGLQQG